MKLHQLNYFVALARLEHYTKAAEEIGISQPTLSHAIAGGGTGCKVVPQAGKKCGTDKVWEIFPGVCGGIHECTGTGSL